MKLKKWIIAQCYPECCFWRVIYKDGKQTYPIPLSEAKGLKKVFGGKIVIDYSKI